MSRLLRRLKPTGTREAGVRGLQALRLAAEAVRFAPGRTEWRRDRLRLLPRSAELLLAREALARRNWKRAEFALRAHFLTRGSRFLIDPSERRQFSLAARGRFPSCVDDAVRRAAPLLDGRYDLLGYRGLSFRSDAAAVDWHFDPVHRRRAPAQFWARVPYLDPACGDHKIIWELNRHQHWLALGRAAWLSDDARYAAAWVLELESWLRANPPLTGINWSSMLELAFRSISWIWALHLFVSFDVAPASVWLLDLLTGLERQLDQVSRHLSTYFSPNTHLLGEGLALYVAGRVLPELESAARWERRGRAILLRELRAQINPDGGHAELSLHYHRYALDFYLLALAVARRTGDAAAVPFADVVSRLAFFCRAMADDHGRLPTIGDDDGGLLFPMCGREPADARDSLCLAAALLGNSELAVGEPPEEVFWMLGGDATGLVQPRAVTPPSQMFPATGYAVLRTSRDHAIVDAGPHGFLNGGHAHADALSLVLSVGRRPLLIDPGTATYTMDPALRDRFRSTAMHNTVVVDARSQSEPAGPFHWASRANARVTCWRPADRNRAAGQTQPSPSRPVPAYPTGTDIEYVEAEHDGYLPLVHRRGVLRVDAGSWLIADHLLGTGHHQLDAYWHLHPAWALDWSAEARVVDDLGLPVTFASTARHWQHFRGDAEGLGWCAPIYGQRVPSLTLAFSDAGDAPLSLVTWIASAPAAGPIALEPVVVTAARDDGWHRTAVTLQNGPEVVVALLATPRAVDGRAIPAGGRASATVALKHGDLVSDARVAVLRISASGAPPTIAALEATRSTWGNRSLFDRDAPATAT
jgi:hypothetical protein